MSDEVNTGEQPPKRRRSVTHIALDWLSQKVRKCEEIKAALSNGDYKVESNKIAKAILNQDKSG